MQFNDTMFCPYGIRCQYIHNSYTPEAQLEISYEKVLNANCEHVKLRLDSLEANSAHPEHSEHLFYISTYYRRRLGVFAQLAQGHSPEF